MFSGNINSNVEKLTNLANFIILGNVFVGTIPPELANLEQIRLIMVHQNDFSGTISKNFCGLYKDPYSLSMLYADCGPTDGIGPPAVECDCCTHCCDTAQKYCIIVENITDSALPTHSPTTYMPTPPPSLTLIAPPNATEQPETLVPTHVPTPLFINVTTADPICNDDPDFSFMYTAGEMSCGELTAQSQPKIERFCNLFEVTRTTCPCTCTSSA